MAVPPDSFAPAAPLTAMIFAAGRGERMRPLTDACPKPLLPVAGKALIVWQIERLAGAGFARIVINHAWLGERIEAALGDGSRWGVDLRYSAEPDALETAGGIAQALPLLEPEGRPLAFVAVAGDIYTDFDYRTLLPHIARAREDAASGAAPRMHLVMVPNPPYHPHGDFALEGTRLLLTDPLAEPLADRPRYTFASFGVYDTRMFHDIPPGTRLALRPYYLSAIERGRASGELYLGRWENIGTPEQLAALDRDLCAANPT